MGRESIKIMYLIDVYKDPYAGTERQLYNLIKGLDKDLFQPALTLFRPSDYINEKGFICNVNSLSITRLLSFITLYKLIRFAIKLRLENYRIIHIFFNDASIAAPIILKLSGMKVLISRRDMGYWYTAASLAILRINRFFIDGVVVNSEAVKQVTHEKEGMPLRKIHTIYNGYDIDSTGNTANCVTLFNGLENKQIIGLVANIRPIKRIDILVKSFAQVNKRFPDSILVIVGDGNPDELKQLAKTLDIDKSVLFTGKQDNVSAIIRHFDIGVLCSESEGLSNVLIEYMQASIPVIATDTGGNPELVRDSITGYLVPVNDASALADKICRVLEGNTEMDKLTTNAFQLVSDLCNMDSMIMNHSRLYQSLLS